MLHSDWQANVQDITPRRAGSVSLLTSISVVSDLTQRLILSPLCLTISSSGRNVKMFVPFSFMTEQLERERERGTEVCEGV